MDIVYPPLAHKEVLVVEVGEDLVNTSIMARLEVEAHPLPYFSDIIWTIASDFGEKQVSGTQSLDIEEWLYYTPFIRLITTVGMEIIASV